MGKHHTASLLSTSGRFLSLLLSFDATGSHHPTCCHIKVVSEPDVKLGGRRLAVPGPVVVPALWILNLELVKLGLKVVMDLLLDDVGQALQDAGCKHLINVPC